MTPPFTKSKKQKSDVDIKVQLRKTLLKDFSKNYAINVLDCCAGHQLVWKALRKDFEVESYLPLDIQNIQGVTRADSVRWIRDVGLGAANVVDVDTFGEPWVHYDAILSAEWGQKDILVFLTLVHGLGEVGGISNMALKMSGMKTTWQKHVPRLSDDTRRIIDHRCLASCFEKGIFIKSFVEYQPTSKTNKNTMYYGLWLEKKSD